MSEKKLTNEEKKIPHFIFERELKPPIKRRSKGIQGYYYYENSNKEFIGRINSKNIFEIKSNPYLQDIYLKICNVLGINYNFRDWGAYDIYDHLIVWLEKELNVKIEDIWRL